MIKRIIRNISSEKLVAGLEFYFGIQDKLTFGGVILKNSNGKLKIQKVLPLTDNWNDLVNNLPSGIPCVINITGKAVFQKDVSRHEDFDKSKLVNSILPTVNAADFYWQINKMEGRSELAVVKKETFDFLLGRLDQLQLNIQVVYLSFYSISSCLEMLELGNASISLLSHTLKFHQGRLIECQPCQQLQFIPTEKISFRGESVETSYLLSYCAAFCYFLGISGDLEGLTNEIVENNKVDQYYKTKFKDVISITLSFSLLVLSLNFVFFQYYYSNTKKFSTSSNFVAESNQTYAHLKNELYNKELFFLKKGWLKAYNLSILSDRIAATLPNTITLNSLVIFPVEDRNSDLKVEPQFVRDTILIDGYCSNPNLLHAWTNDLKSVKRINKVKVDRYLLNTKAGKAEFKLTATLR